MSIYPIKFVMSREEIQSRAGINLSFQLNSGKMTFIADSSISPAAVIRLSSRSSANITENWSILDVMFLNGVLAGIRRHTGVSRRIGYDCDTIGRVRIAGYIRDGTLVRL